MMKKTDRKNDILHSARDLFHDKGYNDTTIDDIVQKAGVGKGTFYRYFSNKTDLLMHKMDLIHEHFKTLLIESLHPESSIEVNIATALDTFLNYYRENIAFFRILEEQCIKHPDLFGEAIRKRTKENLNHFRTLVTQNIESGKLKPADPDILLQYLFIFFHGAKEMESKTGILMDKTRQAMLVGILLEGIKNNEQIF